jgi:hypothetical protein
VIALSLVNNHLTFAFTPTDIVFSHKLAVFPVAPDFFACLQSSAHYHWAWAYSSTMRRDINYSPTDCFETFPFPATAPQLEAIGAQYSDHRSACCTQLNLGLTKIANRFHGRDESPLIRELRDLHVELDRQVLAAYGWSDLRLDHDFRGYGRDTRFTVSDPIRQELLDRLLELNHQRHAAAAQPPSPSTDQKSRQLGLFPDMQRRL